MAPRPLLPSFRYHPAAGELDPAECRLPWPEPRLEGVDLPPGVVGELARERGSRVPGRLVASAKSWLSHAAVDRTAAILPWGAEAGIDRISPVAACAGYLAHVRGAWDQAHPNHPLAEQDVILTLPASFDEDARALTVEAARLAGLERLHLLEEPQAACYAWIDRHRETLAEALGETRLLLVVDVGGGTTDLTLIRVEPGTDPPRLTRIAVGEHLMLGGDNMDLAIAHRVESRLGGRIATGQLAQLVQQCRDAKERLLAADAPESTPVTLLAAGSRLVGGARSTELTRAEVDELLDGFLPRVGPDATPQRRRGAIVEFGLPYAADPAISRHLAAFLHRHAEVAAEALETGEGPPMPDAVLLNGGVFHAHALRRRLLAQLADWRGSPPRLLDNPDPDRAVAYGAVAYGLARRGRGLKI
ncbi:MAG: Hsp70 family protein, partial [Candidatus Competibacterales bacterium]|nr:Hsp70 family protein [Candidatus Competibacterales bacterium]